MLKDIFREFLFSGLADFFISLVTGDPLQLASSVDRLSLARNVSGFP